MARKFDETPFKKLRSPTEEEYAYIAKDLKLSAFQKAALERCVTITSTPCRAFQENSALKVQDGTGLKNATSTARKVIRLLRRLQEEIINNRANVAAIGAVSKPGSLGVMLSSETILQLEATLPTANHKKVDQKTIEHAKQEHSPETRSRMMDFEHSPELLMFILNSIIDRFDGFLNNHMPPKDKGGPSIKIVRAYFIFNLARDASDILEKPISKSGGQPFIDLCNQVLAACNITTTGLEEAIKRCLGKSQTWETVAFENGLDS